VWQEKSNAFDGRSAQSVSKRWARLAAAEGTEPGSLLRQKLPTSALAAKAGKKTPPAAAAAAAKSSQSSAAKKRPAAAASSAAAVGDGGGSAAQGKQKQRKASPKGTYGDLLRIPAVNSVSNPCGSSSSNF